jgi:hypothetical protein
LRERDDDGRRPAGRWDRHGISFGPVLNTAAVALTAFGNVPTGELRLRHANQRIMVQGCDLERPLWQPLALGRWGGEPASAERPRAGQSASPATGDPDHERGAVAAK